MNEKTEPEPNQKLLIDATEMLGAWAWNLGERSLPDAIARLLRDRETKPYLFDQYPGKLHYLVKKRADGKETRTLYVAEGAWQLNAAYAGHAKAGLGDGYDVSCCLVPPDYESVMPWHECPFPVPLHDR